LQIGTDMLFIINFCNLLLQHKIQERTATKRLETDWQFAKRNCYSLSRISWALAQISCLQFWHPGIGMPRIPEFGIGENGRNLEIPGLQTLIIIKTLNKKAINWTWSSACPRLPGPWPLTYNLTSWPKNRISSAVSKKHHKKWRWFGLVDNIVRQMASAAGKWT